VLAEATKRGLDNKAGPMTRLAPRREGERSARERERESERGKSGKQKREAEKKGRAEKRVYYN